jgi:lipopolysaccharide/colanic/teichoic acid biosynthesis glycosyltransferase
MLTSELDGPVTTRTDATFPTSRAALRRSPFAERPRGARTLRYLVALLCALPVVATVGVREGVVVGLVLLSAAALDARRPAVIATLPFARRALTAVTVVAAVVVGGAGALVAWGTIPDLPVVAGCATAALVGLLACAEVEARHAVRRIVVLGTADEAQDLHRTITEVGARGHRVVAHTDSLIDLEDVVSSNDGDLVVYTDHVARPAVLGHLAVAMRHRRVRAMHVGGFCEHALGVVVLPAADAAWLADLADPTGHATDSRVTRVLDVVISLVVLVPVAPLLLLIAPFIAMDGEGGPFFRQQRVGRDGRPFSILKLRTMRGTGSDWASRNDPRVTRLGAVLRKTHVDELPQLLNVLRGDMSLVGPRPEQVRITDELEHEIPLFPYRHMVRPGLTGWARVRCGYATTTEESALKLGNDLYYVKHRSLVLDLAVLLETVRVALFEDQFAVRPPAAEYVLGRSRTDATDDAVRPEVGPRVPLAA